MKVRLIIAVISHILSSCEIKAWKIQARTGFEPMTSVVPVQYSLCEQFQLNTMGSDEIEHKISTVPSNKAPGIEISLCVLKDYLEPILPVKTSSIESCIFPATKK